MHYLYCNILNVYKIVFKMVVLANANVNYSNFLIKIKIIFSKINFVLVAIGIFKKYY